ncbi:MAG: exopolyphosphatase [Desulfobacterales bacterium]|nr:exopolyphosphatase [Desulfobacterales bacterium]
MRIVTRPDFDGIVCAALIYEGEAHVEDPIEWVEPGAIQKGTAEIRKGDIVANLPFDERCSMWFDHHFSNRTEKEFKGSFFIAPSAARVVYKYYRDQIKKNFDELVRETDRIDSADLTLDEVKHPENYPYILLSMSIFNRKSEDEPYWNRLVALLREKNIHEIMLDSEVRKRCNFVVEQNKQYKTMLKKHTVMDGHVSITDFRDYDISPSGNRFLVYSLFPDAVVSIKLQKHHEDSEKRVLSVGHSIFNVNCNVNAGLLLSQYEGGGHRGAAGCSFHKSNEDRYVSKIIAILKKNEPNEEL